MQKPEFYRYCNQIDEKEFAYLKGSFHISLSVHRSPSGSRHNYCDQRECQKSVRATNSGSAYRQ